MSEPDPDDDPQLKSLRAVWLSLPDEDPPERGLAELMSAARQKAEHMAHPSWWQRVLDLIRRPTVLAFATVVVLVSGAVLIGNRKDAMDAEPTAPAGTAAGSAAPKFDQAPATSAAPQATPAPAEEVAPAPTPEPPTMKPPTTHRDRATSDFGGKVSTHPAPPARPSTPAHRGEGAHEAERQLEKVDTESPAADMAPVDTPQQGAIAAPAPAAAPPPPPPSPRGGAEAKPSSLAQLVAQCRAAAGRGDCASARTLASQIARQDPNAYRSQIAGDEAVKRCLATVSE